MAVEIMNNEIERDNQAKKKCNSKFRAEWLHESIVTELPTSVGRHETKFGDIFVYHSERGEVLCQICQQAGAYNDFSVGKQCHEWKMDYLRRHLNNRTHLDSVFKLRQQISQDVQNILNGVNGSLTLQGGVTKSYSYLSEELDSAVLIDCERLKQGFISLVSTAQPSHLHAFFIWLDLKLAEYKIYGEFVPETDHENVWLDERRGSAGAVRMKQSVNSHTSEGGLHLSSSVNQHTEDKQSAAAAAAAAVASAEDDVCQSDESGDIDEEIFCNGSMFINTSTNTNNIKDESLDWDKVKLNTASEQPILSAKSSRHSNQANDGREAVSYNGVNLKVGLTSYPSSKDSTQDKELKQASYSLPMVTGSVEERLMRSSVQYSRSNGTSSHEAVGRGRGAKRVGDATGDCERFEGISEIKRERDYISGQEIPESVVNHSEEIGGGGDDGGDRMIPSHNSSDYKRSVCPYCSKVFQYRSSYRRHVKVHEGIFSHECFVCGRKFARKEHFRRHKCSRRSNKLVFAPSNPGDIEISHLPPEFISPSHVQRFQQISGEESMLNLSSHSSPLSDSLCSTPTPRSDQQGYDESMDPPESLHLTPPGIGERDGRSAVRQLIHESRRKSSTPRKLGILPEFDASISSGACIEVEGSKYGRNNVQDSNSSRHVVQDTIKPQHDAQSSDRSQSHNRSVQNNISDNNTHQTDAARGIVEEKLAVVAPTGGRRWNESDQEMESVDEPMRDQPSTHRNTLPPGECLEEREALPVELVKHYRVYGEDGSGVISTSRRPTGRLGKDAVVGEDGSVTFECPHCSKKFYRSSNFSRHMRIHRGVYSYICTVCCRGFFRREHYTKHKCHRMSQATIG